MTEIFRPSSLDLESDPINVQCLPFKILVTKAMKSKGRDYQHCHHTTHICWQYDHYMTILKDHLSFAKNNWRAKVLQFA